MRVRLLLAAFGVGFSVPPLTAQFPPPAQPFPARTPNFQPTQPPRSAIRPTNFEVPRLPVAPNAPASAPGTPGALPPGLQGTPGVLPPGVLGNQAPPTQPGQPDGSPPRPQPADTPLPYPERRTALDTRGLNLRRVNESWQVWAGQHLMRDFGNREADAKEAVRILRELHVTEWATIGSPRPVVEYGLVNGRPPVTSGLPRVVVPIDLKSARVEPIQGVWCLRDDDSILFNFGAVRADAEQALAVVRRYGFNRVGVVGYPTPLLSYLFVSPEADGAAKASLGPLAEAAQREALTRTGIAVPGVGYVGQMLKIDPRKVEVRKANYEYVLVHGPDVIAKFGPSEWQARDALRLVQDARFTEYGTFAGLNFFLTNGKAPNRMPFSVHGRTFGLGDLRVQQLGERLAVTEGGRHLFDCTTPEEGDQIIRLLRHFQFDQICQLGVSQTGGLRFLAKSR